MRRGSAPSDSMSAISWYSMVALPTCRAPRMLCARGSSRRRLSTEKSRLRNSLSSPPGTIPVFHHGLSLLILCNSVSSSTIPLPALMTPARLLVYIYINYNLLKWG